MAGWPIKYLQENEYTCHHNNYYYNSITLHDGNRLSVFSLRDEPVRTEEIALTDGKTRNQINAWSKDGTLIGYSSTGRNGIDSDLYVMDPRNPASARMVPSSGMVTWYSPRYSSRKASKGSSARSTSSISSTAPGAGACSACSSGRRIR